MSDNEYICICSFKHCSMRITRYIFLVSCLVCLTDLSIAQERRSGEDFGGIAFKVAPPVGDFGNNFNVGWGISAMNEYVLSKIGASPSISPTYAEARSRTTLSRNSR